jgi:hypothetical protein
MITTPWRAGLAGLLTACVLTAAPAKPCYVIDARGQKIEGIELKVTSANGDLELNVDGRMRSTFKAGGYKLASIPKPDEVAALEKALEEGRHAEVIKGAGALFDKYKFLGWGGAIAYLEGMSLLKTGKPQDALRTFDKGRPFAGEAGDELARGTVNALLEMKDTARVQPMLAALMTSPRQADAAFAFLSRGRMLAESGKNKEAVLEYLKVLLFFEDASSLKDLRDDARTRAIAVLKKMNDGRWKQVESIN